MFEDWTKSLKQYKAKEEQTAKEAGNGEWDCKRGWELLLAPSLHPPPIPTLSPDVLHDDIYLEGESMTVFSFQASKLYQLETLTHGLYKRMDSTPPYPNKTKREEQFSILRQKQRSRAINTAAAKADKIWRMEIDFCKRTHSWPFCDTEKWTWIIRFLINTVLW